MDKIKLKALGKINLGLDVLGRRPNGYHDVRMVMQTVYLYDQILSLIHISLSGNQYPLYQTVYMMKISKS